MNEKINYNLSRAPDSKLHKNTVQVLQTILEEVKKSKNEKAISFLSALLEDFIAGARAIKPEDAIKEAIEIVTHEVIMKILHEARESKDEEAINLIDNFLGDLLCGRITPEDAIGRVLAVQKSLNEK